MAFSLQEMEAWLPPEFFPKDDVPLENAYPSNNFFCHLPSKTASFAPEKEINRVFDEDDYSFLLGLGPRPIRPTRFDDNPLQVKEKQGFAVSPVSTLYGTNGLWSSSANGSPTSGASPTEIQMNARDVILAAADQVARLKLGLPPSMATNRYQHCSQYLCYLSNPNQTPRPIYPFEVFNERHRSNDSIKPFFLQQTHTHVPNQTFGSFAPRSVCNASLPKRERSGTGVFLPRQYGGVSTVSNKDPRDLKTGRPIGPRSYCDGKPYEMTGQQAKALRSESSIEVRLPQEWSY